MRESFTKLAEEVNEKTNRYRRILSEKVSEVTDAARHGGVRSRNDHRPCAWKSNRRHAQQRVAYALEYRDGSAQRIESLRASLQVEWETRAVQDRLNSDLWRIEIEGLKRNIADLSSEHERERILSLI
jgi:hypothetical protein